ncbi:MAG: histidine phosphatase family protein [Geobacteraceae bacterium]
MNIKERNNGKCVVYLLRHGDSRQDSVKRYIGQVDTPLNDTGREQALWWRKELSAIPLLAAYSSDLIRSSETVRIITEGRTIVPTSLPGLREISVGLWEGLPIEEVRKKHPGEYGKRGADPAGHRPPEGESFAELQERIIPLFKSIVQDSEGAILVVGHAGVNRILLCHLLGMPLRNLFRLGQDYGCLNVLVGEKGTFSVRSMNVLPAAHSL